MFLAVWMIKGRCKNNIIRLMTKSKSNRNVLPDNISIKLFYTFCDCISYKTDVCESQNQYYVHTVHEFGLFVKSFALYGNFFVSRSNVHPDDHRRYTIYFVYFYFFVSIINSSEWRSIDRYVRWYTNLT